MHWLTKLKSLGCLNFRGSKKVTSAWYLVLSQFCLPMCRLQLQALLGDTVLIVAIFSSTKSLSINTIINESVFLYHTLSELPPHDPLALTVRVKVKLLSRVWLFVTLWTVAYQASPSMGLSRQEYWSGLPFPSPGDLPDPGIEPRSPAL